MYVCTYMFAQVASACTCYLVAELYHIKNNIYVFHTYVHVQVYSWGYNSYGDLGIGNTTNQPSPKPITTLDNQVIIKVI